MKRKIIALFLSLALLAGMCLTFTGCKSEELAVYDKMLKKNKEAITLNIWTYYNNEQKLAFDSLVKEFNANVGSKKKILVKHSSFATVKDLASKVLNSAKEDVGSEPMPNIFQSYSDDLFNLDTDYNIIAELDKYFTKAEISNYVPDFLNEGRLISGGGLKLIPTAKSTEVLMLDKTDWDIFVAENPTVSLDKLKTVEGITEVSEIYYDWSGGKAFFGRDSLANYAIAGASSLGNELFSVTNGVATLQYTKETMRKIYDNFYVPYVKGHFLASQRYRSDDMKNGDVISYVGSSSSATFFPSVITVDNGVERSIEPLVIDFPVFSGGKKTTIQQGAGFAVTSSTELKEYAACVFLKWISAKENSIPFTAKTGYMPTTIDSLDFNAISSQIENATAAVLGSLKVSIDMTKTYKMYTMKPFANSSNIRKVIENAIQGTDKPKEIKNIVNATDMKIIIDEEIKNGRTREDALAAHLTDANFELWYETLTAALGDMLVGN